MLGTHSAKTGISDGIASWWLLVVGQSGSFKNLYLKHDNSQCKWISSYFGGASFISTCHFLISLILVYFILLFQVFDFTSYLVWFTAGLFSFIGEARAYSQIWHYLLLFKICDLSFVLLGSSAIKSLAYLKSWENSLWALDHSGWELKNNGECLWSSIKANAFCISHTLR